MKIDNIRTEFMNGRKVIWKNNKTNLLKKHTLSYLIENLSKKFEFSVSYLIKEKDVTYRINVHFWRLDVIENLKKVYKSEKYVLLIKKGIAETFDPFYDLLIDERIEFDSFEKLVEYLDKTGYLKREEWIISNEKNNNQKVSVRGGKK